MGEEIFEHRNLAGAMFREVNLRGARFREADMRDVVMRGVLLAHVDIDGEVADLRINGVDVAPLVEAELDRRDPDRARMRPTDAAGFRQAWDIVERRWAETVERARGLDPELLHASVDGEWSFIQTLRHLVHATDVWINRVLLGDPRPWHPLGLPFDGADPHPEMPWDREARPTLDEVLAVRAERMATVRRVVADLTDERLGERTTPVEGPSWPPADAYPVIEVLSIVLNEEWQHRVYAERDLDALTSTRTP
ncbi:hypothetical protein DDE18_00670 [Nocardioides gansuensis]|uniref:DinB-like domain-containing protein n=1 Tax=Nocardioides gansuensis TaxID=2138300 RepID=A0A2T8FES7_9ACTN|nr:DinB family protein [Nocardioides gansuensis]PVG84190.1 hypothetical protein DDE18_00670 [Nocardioides gansuensis]